MPKHLGENHLNTSHFNFENDQLSLVNSGDTDVVKPFTVTITHSSPATVTIGTLPANSIVTRIIARTYTAFDGSSPSIDVGISGSTFKYLYSGDYGIVTQNTHHSTLFEKESSEVDIIATVSTGSSTTGSTDIYIEYAVIGSE